MHIAYRRWGVGVLLAAGMAGTALGVTWPLLEVSPTNMARELWQGQDAGSNRFDVWNAGTNADGSGELMTFSNAVAYVDSPGYTGWLSVDPVSGASQGEHRGVWVRLDTAGLPARATPYVGEVRVAGWYPAGPGPANPTQRVVRVAVQVNGVPGLWVSPTTLDKDTTEGWGVAGDTLQVANTGAPPRGVMTYTVTVPQGGGWLSASPGSGSVGDETNPVAVGYAGVEGLAPGAYTGTVRVAALGVGTQDVAVALRVHCKPGLAWNGASQVWTNEASAGGSVGSVSVAVWNASGQPAGRLRYEASVGGDLAGWVVATPASGISTGQTVGFWVHYQTAGLGIGIYTGDLVVAGVDDATGAPATNGPLRTGLRLIVKGAPSLAAAPAQLSAALLENLTATSAVRVWNGGVLPHGGMRYAAVSDVGWAQVSAPSQGVVTNQTGTVQVVWSPGTLPPGRYTGTLRLTAQDAQTAQNAAGSPLLLPLTLTIGERQPRNLEPPAVRGTPHAGQTVTADVGLWQNAGRLTFAYQWERARTATGAGAQTIAGQTGPTYQIVEADRGWYLRVRVTATDPTPWPLQTAAYSPWTARAKVKALYGDFNGDGITDLWYYNEAEGVWRANFGTYSWASGVFGGPGHEAAPGDYDGDGREDIAVYERARGLWHILFLPRGAYVRGTLFGGTPEEALAQPVPADYDGDGATDLALYARGYWAILYSRTWQLAVIPPFADDTGLPAVGDWEGDGAVDLGIYKQGGTWTLRHGNGTVEIRRFGSAVAAQPVPGDYDGDGVSDLALYEPRLNRWIVRESRTGQERAVRFGNGGIVALPGHYDHDGFLDFGQARLSANLDFIIWEVRRTGDTNFPYYGQSYQQSTDRWRVSW